VTTNRRTNCPRGLYFSSPLIAQGGLGRTTGVATADNARILREQWSRATNWVKSKTNGGLVFSVAPAYAVLGRCEAITITGWRLGTTGSDIASVTLGGVPARRILSQTLDSVQVLAGLGTVAGLGDAVITTNSGYTTTLPNSFAYEATTTNSTTDFERGGIDAPWVSTGTLDWRVLRYCDAIPCNNEPSSGPAVGFSGTGSFARAMAVDDTPVEAQLLAKFNTHANGCTEQIHGISLYYHMWGPQTAECRGSLAVEYQNTALQWRTVLTATTVQANQDDPWLLLSYRFASPDSVVALRITAHPYTGAMNCFFWGSVSVDHIVIEKTTSCPDDNCGFISAHPTYSVTDAPTRAPSTLRPTTYRPTTAPPTVFPTLAPTFTRVPAVEVVQFTITQELTGLTAAQFLADVQNSRAFLRAAAEALATSVDNLCCLQVVDVPAAAGVVSHIPSQSMLALNSVVLTYSVTLKVNTLTAPNGDVPHDGGLSPTAFAYFNGTTHRLASNVNSGQFATSLAGSTVALSSAQVEPVASDSFSEPTSFVYRVSSAPTMAPTITAAPATSNGGLFGMGVAAYVILAVILVVISGCTYGLWWAVVRTMKDKSATVELVSGPNSGGERDTDRRAQGPNYSGLLGDDEVSVAATSEDATSVTAAEERPYAQAASPRAKLATPRNMPLPQPLYGHPAWEPPPQAGAGGMLPRTASFHYTDIIAQTPRGAMLRQQSNYQYARLNGGVESYEDLPTGEMGEAGQYPASDMEAGRVFNSGAALGTLATPRNLVRAPTAGTPTATPRMGAPSPRHLYQQQQMQPQRAANVMPTAGYLRPSPVVIRGDGQGSTAPTPRSALPSPGNLSRSSSSAQRSDTALAAGTPRNFMPQQRGTPSNASRGRANEAPVSQEKAEYVPRATSWFEPALSAGSADEAYAQMQMQPLSSEYSPSPRHLARSSSSDVQGPYAERSAQYNDGTRNAGTPTAARMPANFARPPSLMLGTLSSWQERGATPSHQDGGSSKSRSSQPGSTKSAGASGRPPLRPQTSGSGADLTPTAHGGAPTVAQRSTPRSAASTPTASSGESLPRGSPSSAGRRAGQPPPQYAPAVARPFPGAPGYVAAEAASPRGALEARPLLHGSDSSTGAAVVMGTPRGGSGRMRPPAVPAAPSMDSAEARTRAAPDGYDGYPLPLPRVPSVRAAGGVPRAVSLDSAPPGGSNAAFPRPATNATFPRPPPPQHNLSQKSLLQASLYPPPIRTDDARPRNFVADHSSPISVTTTTPTSVQQVVGTIEATLLRQGSSQKMRGGLSPSNSTKDAPSLSSPRHSTAAAISSGDL
jgi:hypothetical protein